MHVQVSRLLDTIIMCMRDNKHSRFLIDHSSRIVFTLDILFAAQEKMTLLKLHYGELGFTFVTYTYTMWYAFIGYSLLLFTHEYAVTLFYDR